MVWASVMIENSHGEDWIVFPYIFLKDGNTWRKNSDAFVWVYFGFMSVFDTLKILSILKVLNIEKVYFGIWYNVQ